MITEDRDVQSKYGIILYCILVYNLLKLNHAALLSQQSIDIILDSLLMEGCFVN